MCGIAGVVGAPDAPPPSVERVRAMCDALVHRGRDAQGVQSCGPLVLGHRRLSIIDLSDAARQPMRSASGRSWIAFNGEIYNYRELRREYESRGAAFHTVSDTEVILAGFELDGAAVWTRLRGMFAVALWDEQSGELWLVRDPVGIKPLCWSWTPRELSFGSEVKALVAGGAATEVAGEALAAYLTRQYIPAPSSVFRGVRKLPAGSYVRVRVREEGAWRTEPEPVVYWRPQDMIANSSATPRTDEVEATLTESVRRHLVADVPVGTFLSGGIDSGIVSALAARHAPVPLPAFTIGFHEIAQDERPLARLTAEFLGLPHHETVVGLGEWDLLPHLAWVFDEPVGDPSILPTYLVCRAARERMTVVLSGDGGDEVFGGYDSYRRHVSGARWRRRLTAPVASLIGEGGRLAYDYGLKGAANLLFLLDASQADAQLHTGYFSTEALRRVAPALPAPSGFPRSEPNGRDEPIRRLQLIDLRSYLPEGMLMKVDRASMAHGLEVRVPMLDLDVLAAGLALGDSERVNGRQGKTVLRRIARRLLPPDIVAAPKRGFGTPLETWFRAELAQQYRDVVLATGARTQALFAPGAAAALLDRHQRRGHNLGPRLWAVLMLELWARAYRVSM